MGSDYSLYEKKLDNPRFSIIAIDKRFLFPNPKIFNIQAGDCCTDPFIQDNDGTSYFRINTFAFSSRKIIYDTFNKPVFNIDKEFLSFSYMLKSGESDQIIANVEKNGFFTYSKFNCRLKNCLVVEMIISKLVVQIIKIFSEFIKEKKKKAHH